MSLKSVQISLDAEEEEVQKVLAITLNEDKEGALTFIKTKLDKRVEKALRLR
jgi:hypothetical protein